MNNRFEPMLSISSLLENRLFRRVIGRVLSPTVCTRRVYKTRRLAFERFTLSGHYIYIYIFHEIDRSDVNLKPTCCAEQRARV